MLIPFHSSTKIAKTWISACWATNRRRNGFFTTFGPTFAARCCTSLDNLPTESTSHSNMFDVFHIPFRTIRHSYMRMLDIVLCIEAPWESNNQIMPSHHHKMPKQKIVVLTSCSIWGWVSHILIESSWWLAMPSFKYSCHIKDASTKPIWCIAFHPDPTLRAVFASVSANQIKIYDLLKPHSIQLRQAFVDDDVGLQSLTNCY